MTAPNDKPTAPERIWALCILIDGENTNFATATSRPDWTEYVRADLIPRLVSREAMAEIVQSAMRSAWEVCLDGDGLALTSHAPFTDRIMALIEGYPP